MTDLREKLAVMVQNKMADHLRVEPDDAKAYPDAEFYEIMGTGPASYAISDAVLSLVIEECAKVAQSHFTGIFTGWKDYPSDSWITLDDAEDAANECGPICAAAIRALAEKP